MPETGGEAAQVRPEQAGQLGQPQHKGDGDWRNRGPSFRVVFCDGNPRGDLLSQEDIYPRRGRMQVWKGEGFEWIPSS